MIRALNGAPRAGRLLVLALILVAGLGVRLAFVGAPGYVDDMTVFAEWVRSALAGPASQLYARDPSINYPPGYALILEATAQAYRRLAPAGGDDTLLRVLIKLPAVVFDLLGVVVAYALVRRFAAPALALAAAAYFAFDPPFVFISAYWGQIDSVPLVLGLAAVLLLLAGIAPLAWPLLAFAVLVKPPIAVLVPLFALFPFATHDTAERKARILGAAAGIVLALAVSEVLAFAFFAHHGPLDAARALLSQLHQGSSRYEFSSLNAFNFWALFSDFFSSDRVRLGPVILKHWAQGLFVLIAAALAAAYVLRRSERALLEGAVLLLLAFFLFMPEMHERYEIYATMFAGVLLFRRRYALAAALLSLTTLLSLEYALTYMRLADANVTAVNVNGFAPWLVRLCALANLGAFFRLAAEYVAPLSAALSGLLRRTSGPRPAAGGAQADPGRV